MCHKVPERANSAQMLALGWHFFSPLCQIFFKLGRLAAITGWAAHQQRRATSLSPIMGTIGQPQGLSLSGLSAWKTSRD
jgi:hypothetical protein